MAHPPFLPPLLSTPDEESWQGGAGSTAPPWKSMPNGLPRGPVHQLLRHANLPEAELLHMGATRAMLSAEATTPLAVRWVAPLLGRIVLDTRYSETGDKYDSAQAAEAKLLGHDVVEAWFCA